MQRRRGFTIVEASIALMVFAFIIVVFASVVLMAKSSANMNGQYAQALSLAQHKIDQLRAVSYGRLTYTELNDAEIVDDAPVTSPFSFVTIDNLNGADAAKEDIGLTNPTATIAISDADADTRKAVVTVSWQSNARNTKISKVVLTAYIVKVE